MTQKLAVRGTFWTVRTADRDRPACGGVSPPPSVPPDLGRIVGALVVPVFLAELLHSYARHHVHPTNVWLHAIGVPAIVFAIVLVSVAAPSLIGLPIAACLLALAARYVLEDRITGGWVAGFLGLASAGAWAIVWSLGCTVALWTALAAFLCGWVLQFVGHCFERSRPAFSRDVRHLMVAPMFVSAEMLGVFGVESKVSRWRRRVEPPAS